ncbi:MAG: beta-mannosidase [Ruminococcus sp.]|nr:beta-mannosidase [Ruminococcus sp.]
MKMWFTRTASLLAAAALTLSAVSCGSGDSSAAESGAASQTAESDTSAADESTASQGYERKPLETQPVVETLGNLDLSEVQNESDVPADFSLEIEAETGTLEGRSAVMTKSSLGDFSGEGYIIVAQDDSTYAEYDIDLETAGSYDLGIISGRAAEDAAGKIFIDGEELAVFSVTSTNFEDNGLRNVTLPAGKHKLSVKSIKSNLFIDKLTFSSTAKVDLSVYDVKKELCNPNAGDETKRLYNFLTDIYGKYTLSGQYSGDNMGPTSAEFYVIDTTTGKTPAILGLDLMDLSPSRIAHGASGGQKVPQQAIDWWNDKGGIVTLCWHWNAPEPYLGQGDTDWWSGFYSDQTTFSLAKALSKEDQEGYDYIIRDIDAIAETLAYLDDQHIPILWRPLHEGGGDPKWKNPWFWWGSSGAKAYIELWKLMYDRLTNYHHINNLIWVWNGQDPTYYPGDEYVDIIGYDYYADKGDTSSQKEIFDLMRSVTSEKKIIAMTENGVIPDPAECFADGSRWCWFATWNGEFMVNSDMEISDYTGAEKATEFYNSERVLTLDELPDLKSYPLDTEKFLAENAG